MALEYIKAYIPTGVGDMTLANIVLGLFTFAGAVVVKFVDDYLAQVLSLKKAMAEEKKLQVQLQKKNLGL